MNQDSLTITVRYVGSSLLAPLRHAERECRNKGGLDLRIVTHNCGGPVQDSEWETIERDLARSSAVFVIHVKDTENAERIAGALDRLRSRHDAVVPINCLASLMRHAKMGKVRFGGRETSRSGAASGLTAGRFVRKLGSWISDYAPAHRNGSRTDRTTQYLKYLRRVPALLKLLPQSGTLGDLKHYLAIYCYFLQPTPSNIHSMVLYTIKHYVPDFADQVCVEPPESMPAMGIYHPDAPSVFERFETYRTWYEKPRGFRLEAHNTIGLLVLRPAIVSGSRRHYDGLIREIEEQGLAVIPAISTLMDNRQACEAFFLEADLNGSKRVSGRRGNESEKRRSRVSQIVSLTGFSFVGGPATNDSAAAIEFLSKLGSPLRSVVSLDLQTIESWQASSLGLNPVQSGMQVAIPEIDGATEPLIFGGIA